jgi:DNA end-binding protein Ku
MARSIWSGTISFWLIAIPVKLYTAVRHKGVSFNQLDERNMGRIRYQKVSEQTGDEVPADQIVKGYEITRGRYIVIDTDELEPFAPSNTKTIELEEFVNLDQIDPSTSRSPTTSARTSTRSPTCCSPGRSSRPARWRSPAS